MHGILLIHCKFKCYGHHVIIYSILNNVLNLCNFVCNFCIIAYEIHIPSNAPNIVVPTSITRKIFFLVSKLWQWIDLIILVFLLSSLLLWWNFHFLNLFHYIVLYLRVGRSTVECLTRYMYELWFYINIFACLCQ